MVENGDISKNDKNIGRKNKPLRTSIEAKILKKFLQQSSDECGRIKGLELEQVPKPKYFPSKLTNWPYFIPKFLTNDSLQL